VSLFRSLSATLLLVTAMTVGLGGGFLAPAQFDTNVILWPSIFAQTVTAVGGLRPDWLTERAKRADAIRLLVIHHTAATVPYLLAWLFLPADLKASPLAIGLIWLAIVPTAAGLPAYATAARTSPTTITAFALLAYLSGLLITPLLALLLFGGAADIGMLLLSMGAGLIVPALLGVLLGRGIRRIPPQVRTGVVAACMAITTYVFASAMRETLATGALPIGLVLVALAAGAARVPVSAALGMLMTLRRPGLRAAAAVAAGYKNDALAASTALQVAGPVAVLPALGSLLCEMALMVGATLAAHHAGQRRGFQGTRLGMQPEPDV